SSLSFLLHEVSDLLSTTTSSYLTFNSSCLTSSLLCSSLSCLLGTMLVSWVSIISLCLTINSLFEALSLAYSFSRTLHFDLYFLITCWYSSRMFCTSIGDKQCSLSSLEESSLSLTLELPLAIKHMGGRGRGASSPSSSSSCMAIPTIFFLDSSSLESSFEDSPSVIHSPRKALTFSFLLKDPFFLWSFFSLMSC